MKKILLVGYSGCGKTTYVNILKGLNFLPIYRPSDELVINQINNDLIIYEIGGQTDWQYNNNIMNDIDKIVIMMDIQNVTNINEYINKYIIYDKPIYLCINKIDCKISNPKYIALEEYLQRLQDRYNISIIRISCRSGENIDFIYFL
jgi:GTPase SAR1 family protein